MSEQIAPSYFWQISLTSLALGFLLGIVHGVVTPKPPAPTTIQLDKSDYLIIRHDNHRIFIIPQEDNQ